MLKVLRSAFVDALIHNDKEVASSKTHTQFKSAKTTHYLRPKWPTSIPYFRPKVPPFGAAHTSITHTPPPPRGVFTHPSNVLRFDPESVQLSSVEVSISFVLEFDFLTFVVFSYHLEIHIGVRASVFLRGCLEFHVIFRVWWRYIRNISEKWIVFYAKTEIK